MSWVCHVPSVHRSASEPGLFLFYEAYRDAAAFDAHRGAAHLAAFRDRREREALVAGPAQVQTYRALTD